MSHERLRREGRILAPGAGNHAEGVSLGKI